MRRYDCLKLLLSELPENTVTITSLSYNRKQWSVLRGDTLSFYGLNMGLCTPLAVGIAAARKELRVVAIDSDGSLLLDPGVLITAARLRLKNLLIIVFDNGSFNGYGRTPSHGTGSFRDIAKASGIANSHSTKTLREFARAIEDGLRFRELGFIHAKIELREEKTDNTISNYLDGRLIREVFQRDLNKIVKGTII